MRALLLITILFMGILQTSCDGDSQSSALRALNRMKEKDYFNSPLDVAFAKSVAQGDRQRMQKFLEQGVDVNTEGKEQMRFLWWALIKQNLDGFSFLLENGSDWKIEIFDGKRPISLMEAVVIMENSEYLHKLLSHGADPNHRVGYAERTRTVIYEAIINRAMKNVQLLIESGADVNHQDLSGATPIMTAAGVKNFDMVYFFIQRGADLSSINRWGNDLVWMINEFGDRGIKPSSDQYRWYLKVVKELKNRGLIDRDWNPTQPAHAREVERLRRKGFFQGL
jgi:ankyrin repeat protein